MHITPVINIKFVICLRNEYKIYRNANSNIISGTFHRCNSFTYSQLLTNLTVNKVYQHVEVLYKNKPLHLPCRIMWLMGLIMLMSGLARADREQQWVNCLMTICTDHFPPGRTVAVFPPTDEHYGRMTDIGHHLIRSIHQADRWPLIVSRDTGKDSAEIVNSYDK